MLRLKLTAASRRAGTIPAYEPSYDERVFSAAKGAEARYVKAGLGSAESRAAELEEQKELNSSRCCLISQQTALGICRSYARRNRRYERSRAFGYGRAANKVTADYWRTGSTAA